MPTSARTAISTCFDGFVDDVFMDAARDSWQRKRIRFLTRTHFNERSPIMKRCAEKLSRQCGAADEEAYRHRMLRTYASTRIDDASAAKNLREKTYAIVRQRRKAGTRLIAAHDTSHIIKKYANPKQPGYEGARMVHDNAEKIIAPGYTFGSTTLCLQRGGIHHGVPLSFELNLEEKGGKLKSDPNIIQALALATDDECRQHGLPVTHVADSAIDSWNHLEALKFVSLVFAERGSRKLTTPTGRTFWHDEILTKLLIERKEEMAMWLKNESLMGVVHTLEYEGLQFECLIRGRPKVSKKTGGREWDGSLVLSYTATYHRKKAEQRFKCVTEVNPKKLESAASRWEKRLENLMKKGNRDVTSAAQKKKLPADPQTRIFKISCSNDFSLSAEEILLTRRKRWSVEEMHRTLKWKRDGIGDKFLIRKIGRIRRHIFICFLILAFIIFLPYFMHRSELAIALWGRRRYREKTRKYLDGKIYPWYTLLRWVDRL